MSQIRSHVEYLILICNIHVLILWSKVMKNQALMAVFNTIWWWFLIVAYFLGNPVSNIQNQSELVYNFSSKHQINRLIYNYFHRYRSWNYCGVLCVFRLENLWRCSWPKTRRSTIMPWKSWAQRNRRNQFQSQEYAMHAISALCVTW